MARRRTLLGLEANYFDVTGRPDNYDSGQTTGSTLPLVRAFYDPTIPGVVPGFVAVPGIAAGRITVDTNDYFQSAGIWLRRQLQASEWSTNDSDVNWTDSSARTFRLDAIGGYRFARLIDSVNEQDSEFDPSLNQYTNINNYRTVNDFNGLELGLDAVYTFSHWSLDVVGKAAVGFNNQNVSLYYLTELDTTNSGGGPLPPSTASPEISRNCFSVIPQLELNLGYQVTDHLKVTGGYDLLYWTNVVQARRLRSPLGLELPPIPSIGVRLQPRAADREHDDLQGRRGCIWAPNCGSEQRACQDEKGQETARSPALFLWEDRQTCVIGRLTQRFSILHWLKSSTRFRPRGQCAGPFGELDRQAGQRHLLPIGRRLTVRAPRRTGYRPS